MTRPVAPPAPPAPPGPAEVEGPHDLSLLYGGPFFQVLLRAGLIRPGFDLLLRRMLVLALLPWLPLLVLTLIAGTAWRGRVDVPFLLDLETHVRFLVTVPLLVLAERVIHLRLRPLLARFVERGLVAGDDTARFDAILESARRWRGSYVVEGLLLVASFALTPLLWARELALTVSTWYGTPGPDGTDLTTAGTWFAYGALPILRFLLWRWLYRLVLLVVAFARISRLRLRIVPTHPDGAGGLAFVGDLGHVLQPFHAAVSAFVSGFIGGKILFQGQALADYYALIGSVLGLLLLLTLLPMLFFDPVLTRARRAGLREYGDLAQTYVRGFHERWVERRPPPTDPLLGSADIQSLADLAASFELVRTMRTIPLSIRQSLQVLAVGALPFAPLLLTVLPIDVLLQKVLTLLI